MVINIFFLVLQDNIWIFSIIYGIKLYIVYVICEYFQLFLVFKAYSPYHIKGYIHNYIFSNNMRSIPIPIRYVNNLLLY